MNTAKEVLVIRHICSLLLELPIGLDANRQRIFGPKSRVNVEQPHQAMDQEAGPDQQDISQRHLSDHEGFPDPESSRPRAGGASAVMQNDAIFSSRQGHRRNDSEQKRGERCCQSSHSQTKAIDASRIEEWNVESAISGDEGRCRIGEWKSQSTSGCRKQKALGQHLANESRAVCPEGHSSRHLVTAAGASSQKQVGQIGARDQQDRSNGARQNEERTAMGSTDALPQRREAGPELPALGVCVLQLAIEQIEFALRMLDGNSGLQPADNSHHISEVVVSRVWFVREHEVHSLIAGPEDSRKSIIKFRRQYSDDDPGGTTNRKGPSNGAAISAI